MKKIAFFISSEIIGGHEFQARELILDVSEYHETTVFLDTKEHLSLFEEMDVRIVIPTKKFFVAKGTFIFQYIYGLLNLFLLRKMTRKFNHIIVCAGSIEAGISLGWALFGENTFLYVPTFIDRKVLWGGIGCLYNSLFGIFVLPYKKIITINKYQAAKFAQYKNTVFLPNRTFLPCTLPNTKCFCEKPKRKLYFVGRFDKHKKIIELIEWLDYSANKFETLVLVGDGPDRKKIEMKIKKIKHIKVIVMGWLDREKQEKLFDENDVFVSNSAFEGEPLVILEANERGSVVIARDILGHRGCTHIANRFDDKVKLMKLLELAYQKKLVKFKNRPIEEVNQRRRSVVREIFL